MAATKSLLFSVMFLIGGFQLGVIGVPPGQFYPFGPLHGDEVLEAGDDISSHEILLDVPLVFFNATHRTIYVNVNGHVSMEFEVSDYRADLALPLGARLIAIFLADVDTRAVGRVYYRSTSEGRLLQTAAADIRTNFTSFESYSPSSLFIVTWDRVGYYNEQADKLNTFQLILASDGKDSFAIFHYLDSGIQWMRSQGKFSPSYEDIPPQAGFDGGEGGYTYTLPGSGETGSFVRSSNINIPGAWMFHIGNTGTGNIRPAEANIGDVTLFEVENSQSNCFQGSTVCHTNAQCMDHNGGVCCECVPPSFGNGYHCLDPGVPQKLNGHVYGELNGVPLDSNLMMHTYVVTTDGRTYSAISRVPLGLGAAMQTLNSIGGIIGWLFALPVSARARNGYIYTGGVFNRTARITFQSADRGDYVVRLYQVFHGHDSLNNIRMETRLEGNMPEVPEGATVTVDDYNENYKRTAPGTIKSFVARTYRVNDVAYRYTWDNTITYSECEFADQRVNNDIMRVSVTRHYVKHSEQDKVVRFAMTSKVGVFTGSDPCSDTGRTCSENADCVQDGGSYNCACRPGFTGDGETCQDIDECRRNPCDQNSRCHNLPGSFQCQCLPGFTGDGHVCRAEVRLCGQVVCDRNAQCVFSDDRREPRCECSHGFQGDGVRCTPIQRSCHEADICGDNAKCVYDENLREYYCECLDEFSGDGFSCEPTGTGCGDCDRFAHCVADPARNTYMCQCDPGYTGDGKRCTLIDTCANCDHHARCIFNDETSDYECICVRGYQGDGRTCHLRDCREDPGMCSPVGGLCWHDVDRNVSICRCNHGYRGDGFTCNEMGCNVANDCDENAKCVSVDSRHTCQCNPGFVGDGRRCLPQPQGRAPSECHEVNDCDINARCVPNPEDPRRYMCKCNPGYQGDGRVCLMRFVPCNQVNNCDRNAECVYDPDVLSYTCRCSRGYEGDGIVCMKKEIADCRRTPEMCSADAECVQGAEDIYVCVCRPGYRGDGTTCSHVVREGNYLIYAQDSKVMRISSDSRSGDLGQQLVHIPGMLAIAVDTDCQNGDLYWTDAAMGVIRRAKLNGTGVETIISGLESPEGIAIDYAARNIFFTDSELDIVQVSRLDGSSRKSLVSTDMVNPRAIVLDINRGVVFWTDWNRNRPQIERMSMDGTQRKVLVEDGLRLPNGLAFDTFSQTLCWGDAGTHSIECIRSDGVGRRVVYDKATYPFHIAILNNIIYWTDWQRREIPNVSQNGGEENQALKQAIGGHGRVYGITAVRDQCPRVRNSCGLNNGGCRYLCLASTHGGRTCACPDGTDPRVCQQ